MRRSTDDAARRAAGQGSRRPSELARHHSLHARAGRGDRRDGRAVRASATIRRCSSPTSPIESKPDEWLIHAYFEHEPEAEELAMLAPARQRRAARRAARRGRLGDDEPGRAAADPRRPLLRPHADVPRAFRRERSRSRSTRASPSAPASMRRPPAASRRSTRSSATARASPTSPTSAPAPACSPSPRWRSGPRRSASRPTSTRSRSTSRATMRRSTA